MNNHRNGKKSGQRNAKSFIALVGILLLVLIFHQGSWVLSLLEASSGENCKSVPLDEPASQMDTASAKRTLFSMYSKKVEELVRKGNFDMGCADLAPIAPYFRAVADRMRNKEPIRSKRNANRLIFDIGANTGQDAETIMASFQRPFGMCHNYGTKFVAISIEPSPKIFCEMMKNVEPRDWKPPSQQFIGLNIGMSDKIGKSEYEVKGLEDGGLGKVVEGNATGELMTLQDFQTLTTCQTHKDAKKHIVQTHTMDSMVASLKKLNTIHEEVISGIKQQDEVFLLKIDAEGHDEFVIKGANDLLAQKQIAFILFEIKWNKQLLEITRFLDTHDYLCFIIHFDFLIPIHHKDWWYEKLNNNPKLWWGNGVCGIRGSKSLSMLYKMYHSDDDALLNAHDIIMN